ncbi:hypothetical protein C8J57DRAFT_1235523 [Mycena rebaudengoi]|nr:hypothetical protein C8J57DRAFT_1235523 [Mycena rebaudengoi]
MYRQVGVQAEQSRVHCTSIGMTTIHPYVPGQGGVVLVEDVVQGVPGGHNEAQSWSSLAPPAEGGGENSDGQGGGSFDKILAPPESSTWRCGHENTPKPVTQFSTILGIEVQDSGERGAHTGTGPEGTVNVNGVKGDEEGDIRVKKKVHNGGLSNLYVVVEPGVMEGAREGQQDSQYRQGLMSRRMGGKEREEDGRKKEAMRDERVGNYLHYSITFHDGFIRPHGPASH